MTIAVARLDVAVVIIIARGVARDVTIDVTVTLAIHVTYL